MNNPHIHTSFDDDLNHIHDHILGMAEMVFSELEDSVEAFVQRDEESANDTLQIDTLINANERLIEQEVVNSIVLHQPMASDCRKLIAALRISRELERIGDYAKSIASHSIALDQLDVTGEEPRITDLAHATQTMLREAIEAYQNLNGKQAQLIREQDEAIDELYTRIFQDLINISDKNECHSSACTHLLMVARSLERVGDIVTDIAEDVLYIVGGEFVDDDRPKADETASIIGPDA